MSIQEIVPVRHRPDTGLGQMPLSDPRARAFQMWAEQNQRPRRRSARPRPPAAKAPVAGPTFQNRLDTYA